MKPSGRQVDFVRAVAPTEHQSAVVEWMRTGTGNAIVRAVAGSGKTSLLMMAAETIDEVDPRSGNAIVIAYNSAIALEIGRKLKRQCSPLAARTFHSLGLAAFKSEYKHEHDKDKYSKIIREKIDRASRGGVDGRNTSKEEMELLSSGSIRGVTRKLVDLARDHLTTTSDDLRAIIGHYDLPVDLRLEDLVIFLAQRAIHDGVRDLATQDFGDQVWLPLHLNLPFVTYPWVLVDECQDLSPGRVAIAERCLGADGRLIAVGDPNQAIMGFSGTDDRSFWNVKKRFSCREFPLSVCFRCGSTIVDLARSYVPDISPRHDAPHGEVRLSSYEGMLDGVIKRDMIICRRNAPLMSVCFGLLRRNLKPKIVGRDFYKNLKDRLRDAQPHLNAHLTNLSEVLRSQLEERRKILGEDADSDLDERRDANECLCVLRTVPPLATSYEQLEERLKKLSAIKTPDVTLSTIHRAKGLESDRVWVVESDKLMPPDVRGDWKTEQEKNLAYVAYTRAKTHLFLVSDEEPDDIWDR